MSDDATDVATSTEPRPPSSPFHPPVGADASIDACPFGALIKGLNVDPNLVFDLLTQYFGAGELDGDEDAAETIL